MKIHLVAATTVLALATAYGITGASLGLVVLVICVVVAMEIMNTAIELTCDLIASVAALSYPNESIRVIKDLAAGAVLVTSMGAVVVGALTYTPLLV